MSFSDHCARQSCWPRTNCHQAVRRTKCGCGEDRVSNDSEDVDDLEASGMLCQHLESGSEIGVTVAGVIENAAQDRPFHLELPSASHPSCHQRCACELRRGRAATSLRGARPQRENLSCWLTGCEMPP